MGISSLRAVIVYQHVRGEADFGHCEVTRGSTIANRARTHLMLCSRKGNAGDPLL